MKDLLNPYQKNSLRVTLQTFEEDLRHTLDWLDGREENGILYNRRLNLPKEGREHARQGINVALGLIENLRKKFELHKETSDAASMLQGELTVSWANLHDARAKKLTRFGKVHPELESILDQDIQNLAEIALHLSTILSKSQQEKP